MIQFNDVDPDELEALFDSIVAANAEAEAAPVSVESVEQEAEVRVLNQVGQMTRTLHDALSELGLHRQVEQAITDTVTDARERLNYIETLTQNAANRVLNATDAAQPLVDKLGSKSARLAGQWQMLFDGRLDVAQFKYLVMQTRSFLDHEIPEQTRATHVRLQEIMMAQDFQDLTGQVIKRLLELTRTTEQQLVQLLLDTAPPEIKAEFDAGNTCGPVIDATGRTDVVTNQQQVDDLLESLGF